MPIKLKIDGSEKRTIRNHIFTELRKYSYTFGDIPVEDMQDFIDSMTPPDILPHIIKVREVGLLERRYRLKFILHDDINTVLSVHGGDLGDVNCIPAMDLVLDSSNKYYEGVSTWVRQYVQLNTDAENVLYWANTLVDYSSSLLQVSSTWPELVALLPEYKRRRIENETIVRKSRAPNGFNKKGFLENKDRLDNILTRCLLAGRSEQKYSYYVEQ